MLINYSDDIPDFCGSHLGPQPYSSLLAIKLNPDAASRTVIILLSGIESCRSAPETALVLRLVSHLERDRHGVSGGDDGSVSGRPRSGLRLLRRRSHLDSVRQHEAGGGADSGRRHPAEDASILRVTESLPVCREVRTPGERQRQGQGGGLGGLRAAQLPGTGSASGELRRVKRAVAERVPGAPNAAATRPPGGDWRVLRARPGGVSSAAG